MRGFPVSICRYSQARGNKRRMALTNWAECYCASLADGGEFEMIQIG